MTGVSGLRAAATDRWSRVERDGFTDLVCAEPHWLDTEFAAIITANFGPSAFDPDLPVPPPPHRDFPAGPRPGRREPAPISAAPATPPSRTARQVGACERSPPQFTLIERRTIHEEVVPTVPDVRPESVGRSR